MKMKSKIPAELIIEKKTEFEYEIGEFVYLFTDSDSNKRVVDAIMILPNNLVQYRLMCKTDSSWHYEFEITRKKNII